MDITTITEISGKMRYFKIEKIEGEYATLIEEGSGEELFIALALLPIGADIGSRIAMENFEFSLI